jgi:hypothetical protein
MEKFRLQPAAAAGDAIDASVAEPVAGGPNVDGAIDPAAEMSDKLGCTVEAAEAFDGHQMTFRGRPRRLWRQSTEECYLSTSSSGEINFRLTV